VKNEEKELRGTWKQEEKRRRRIRDVEEVEECGWISIRTQYDIFYTFYDQWAELVFHHWLTRLSR
jgi:hypothetical protein